MTSTAKIPYTKASAEVIRFDNSDVITTSGENHWCLGSGYDNPGSGCADRVHADYPLGQ